MNREELRRFSEGELAWLFNETGDRTYICEMYGRYLPLVYGVCLKYMSGPAEAEQACRDFYENICSHAGKELLDAESPGRWLYDRLRSYIAESVPDSILVEV